MKLHYIKIFSPSSTYFFIWLLVLGLLSLRWTENIPKFTIEMIAPVITSLLFAILIIIAYEWKVKIDIDRMVNKINENIKKIKKIQNHFTVGFILLTFVDVMYSQGMPLLWIFTGAEKTYANIGIPSIRGLQYTLYLMSLVLLGLIRGIEPNYKTTLMWGLFIFPLLMLARGLFTYALIQYSFSRFMLVKFNRKHVAVCGAIVIIYALMFGVIGDVRHGISNPLAYLIAEGEYNPLSSLPSGFTWLYIYITSGYANILQTFDSVVTQYSFSPILYNLVPGAIKVQLGMQSNEAGIIADESLNVASFFAGYFVSFSLVGAIIGSLFLLLISIWWYAKLMRGEIFSIIGYSACLAAIILSPFFDALMTVSTVFQFIVSFYLRGRIKF